MSHSRNIQGLCSYPLLGGSGTEAELEMSTAKAWECCASGIIVKLTALCGGKCQFRKIENQSLAAFDGPDASDHGSPEDFHVNEYMSSHYLLLGTQ